MTPTSRSTGPRERVATSPSSSSAPCSRRPRSGSALKSDLESALEDDEFTLLYHPIFDLDGIEIQGVEALLRWQHPTKGTIAPDVFIPVLEERGLIVDVGRWVLNESCREAAAWHRQGHRTSISVNVSMRQLESDQLVEDVRNALTANGLDPAMLILEVTESTLMRDSVATVARLNSLKQLGVKVAIDDFGTGYSSLAYLRQFPVDVLKIDRSFVADMSRSPDAAALIHTLIELGRTLGLVTLAEGIETHEQLEGLRAEKCDHGQGFLFSGPVDGVGDGRLLEIARAARSIRRRGRVRLPRPGRPRRPPGRSVDVVRRSAGAAGRSAGSRIGGRAGERCRRAGQSPRRSATAASGSSTRKLKLSSR